tara:strand:- start:3125 stop:3739 length:615 start_codon:yes stop_codon:yes gene_type:complete
MLISHKYKFIFIKTKKTAGTSIEIELGKNMDDNDVVTPIKPNFKGHQARNFIYKGFKLNNHISAQNLKIILPKNIFENYFKFCVEREPVDKSISDYSMLKNSTYHNRHTKFLKWNEYVDACKFPMDVYKYIDKKEQLLVDKIIKYENLNNEIYEISKKLGFPFSGINVRAKSGFRENIAATNKQKKVIYNAFEKSNKYTFYKII